MLLKNATVHDGLGRAEVLDILIENGRIAAIGPSLPGEGEDLTGKHITPGLIWTISSWGVAGSVTEIRPSSNDNDEHSDPITPDLDGFYAFGGRAASNQQLCAFGLTTVGVAPTDNNLFGGTIAAFHAEGVNPYRLVLNRNIGMMSSVTPSLKNTYGKSQKAPMTRMQIFAMFSEQLRKASAYDETKEGVTRDPKLAALKKIVDGEIPLFISCDTQLSVFRVLEIISAYPSIRTVIVNGFGLTGEEDILAEKKIPVVVRMASFPRDEIAKGLDLHAIARLMEKGVPVVLSGSYTNGMDARESLLWNSAEMMRTLHDSEKVLSMITSEPAKLLKIDDKTGSIREGLMADLVIWNADPMKSWQASIYRTIQEGTIVYKEGDVLKCM